MPLSCYVPSQIIPKSRIVHLADKQILKRHILSYPKITVSKNPPRGWGVGGGGGFRYLAHGLLARGLTQRPVLMSARENLLVLPTNPEAKHRLRKALPSIIIMWSIRKRLRSSGFSQTASSVICSSWRKRYANKRGIHSDSPSVNEGVKFLGMLFNAGLSYSAICVARSALSSYLDCKDAAQFGEHERVSL